MASVQQDLPLLLSCLLSGIFMSSVSCSYHNRIYTPPVVPPLTDSFPRLPVDQGFDKAYGAPNIKLLNNGSMATIALDNITGCGLVSKNAYHHGFFSASIKLPAGLASGVVVAFYLSNAEKFPQKHDEIDIELLGRDRKDDWVFQTNVYANGSVSTGREEKFYFWFDPTQDYHHYSILWNPHHIVFMVDNIPVREFRNNGVVYPSKPMSVYMTIWDGSDWATHGGKYPVNYEKAPFVASVTGTEMAGCVADDPAAPNSTCSKRSGAAPGVDPVDGQDFVKLSDEQAVGLDWARRKLMFYSYCKDTARYKVVRPPECSASRNRMT